MYGGIAQARRFSTEIVVNPFDPSRVRQKSLIFTLVICYIHELNKENYIMLRGLQTVINRNVYIHTDVGKNSNAIMLLKSYFNLVLCL